MLEKKLKIITDPNPILRKKSKNIDRKTAKTDEFKQLCVNMVKTMIEDDGAGLAATQIGKNIRLIIINTKDGPIAMINPTLSKKSLKKEWDNEGCLSVPNVFGDVKRHKVVRCKFNDINSNVQMIEAKGLMARVIQHEIDHLDGILFIDKAKNIETYEKN